MRASMRVLLTTTLATALAGGLAGHAADKPVVGLVMKSLANEFFKSMEEGAVKYAKQDGTFTLVPVGMNSETDIDTQISAVENFIPLYSGGLCEAVKLIPPAARLWRMVCEMVGVGVA